MANTEYIGVFTHVDDSGNTNSLYPVTKAEAVEGLDEAIDGALPQNNNLITFTSLDQLAEYTGVDVSTLTTLKTIVKAMPDGSSLTIEWASSSGIDISDSNGDFPYGNGMLQIIRYSLNRNSIGLYRSGTEGNDSGFSHTNYASSTDIIAPWMVLSRDRTMTFKRLLSAGEDLNNLVENGIYAWTTDDTVPTNAPTSLISIVEVFGSTSDTSQVIQRVTRYASSGHTWIRTLYAGAWTEWTKHLMVSDIVDNLTSTSTALPLSAKQGKVLKDKLDALSDDVDVIGTTTTVDCEYTSVAASTAKNLAKVTLSAGTYLIRAAAIFKGTGASSDGWSGYRRIVITSASSDTTTLHPNGSTQVAGYPSNQTVIEATSIRTITSSTTFYCNVMHTAAAAIEVKGQMTAIRIA